MPIPAPSPWDRLRDFQKQLPDNFLFINKIKLSSEDLIELHIRFTFAASVEFVIKYLEYHEKMKPDEIAKFFRVAKSQIYRYKEKGYSIHGRTLDYALRTARRKFGDHFRNQELSDQVR